MVCQRICRVGMCASHCSVRITVLNRPICFFRIFSASDLKSNRLDGLKAFIWSNLCTRHIPNKLTLRGHEDWPDKRDYLKLADPDSKRGLVPTNAPCIN